jgi:diaminopimelate epimerase
LQNGTATVHSITTGVPHAVLFVSDLERFPVQKVGREVRYHKKFAPKGANVNFVKILKPGLIRIRTYERGVEDETLACGTGMVACALISNLVHGFKSPVRVRVQGGDTLVVSFKKNGNKFEEVKLLGPAEVTFKGECYV